MDGLCQTNRHLIFEVEESTKIEAVRCRREKPPPQKTEDVIESVLRVSECVSGFSAGSRAQAAGLVWCERKSEFIQTDLDVCVIGSEATAALYLSQ